MNRGEEDYIKAIYELEGESQSDRLVTNYQLSHYFSHTAQTVNEMVKRLVKRCMVEYTPYKGSILTEEGRTAAVRMIRVHRIWETFLVDKLGYSWDEVHAEAECLEHVTTTKLEERLFSFLDKPKACPHGNTIPGFEEKILTKDGNIRLIEAVEKEMYCLIRVTDNKDLLTYLNRLEICIGQQFRVERVDSISEIIELLIDNRKVVVGYRVAKELYVSNC